MDRAQRFFHYTTPQFGTLKTIFERGRAENDEISKSSFPFQPQTKNGKSLASSIHGHTAYCLICEVQRVHDIKNAISQTVFFNNSEVFLKKHS